MHRINTPADVVATGLVQVDAGQGVTLEVPLVPAEGGGGGVPADHPALYMSGVRNVAGDLTAGWRAATTGVRLSRQGATVTLALDVFRVGDKTSFDEVIPIPLGFRPITSGYIQPGKSAGYNDGTTSWPAIEGWFDRLGTATPIRFRDWFNSASYDVEEPDTPTTPTFKDGQRLTNVISWQTIDAIPTSLPGIPA